MNDTQASRSSICSTLDQSICFRCLLRTSATESSSCTAVENGAAALHSSCMSVSFQAVRVTSQRERLLVRTCWAYPSMHPSSPRGVHADDRPARRPFARAPFCLVAVLFAAVFPRSPSKESSQTPRVPGAGGLSQCSRRSRAPLASASCLSRSLLVPPASGLLIY
jgi:hypothetical protein